MTIIQVLSNYNYISTSIIMYIANNIIAVCIAIATSEKCLVNSVQVATYPDRVNFSTYHIKNS